MERSIRRKYRIKAAIGGNGLVQVWLYLAIYSIWSHGPLVPARYEVSSYFHAASKSCFLTLSTAPIGALRLIGVEQYSVVGAKHTKYAVSCTSTPDTHRFPTSLPERQLVHPMP